MHTKSNYRPMINRHFVFGSFFAPTDRAKWERYLGLPLCLVCSISTPRYPSRGFPFDRLKRPRGDTSGEMDQPGQLLPACAAFYTPRTHKTAQTTRKQTITIECNVLTWRKLSNFRSNFPTNGQWTGHRLYACMELAMHL